MPKYAVMTNVKDGEDARLYYPNSNYPREESIANGFFHSTEVRARGGTIYEKDLFNTKKEAKQFEKNCGMQFPETIVKEIDDNDPRIVRA